MTISPYTVRLRSFEGGTVAGNGAGAIFVASREARGAISIRATKLEGKRAFELSRAFRVSIDSAPAGSGAPRAESL